MAWHTLLFLSFMTDCCIMYVLSFPPFNVFMVLTFRPYYCPRRVCTFLIWKYMLWLFWRWRMKLLIYRWSEKSGVQFPRNALGWGGVGLSGVLDLWLGKGVILLFFFLFFCLPEVVVRWPQDVPIRYVCLSSMQMSSNFSLKICYWRSLMLNLP